MLPYGMAVFKSLAFDLLVRQLGCLNGNDCLDKQEVVIMFQSDRPPYKDHKHFFFRAFQYTNFSFDCIADSQ